MSSLPTPPHTPPAATHAHSDILFVSATVVAGDDTPAYVADVLVVDGLIADITPVSSSSSSARQNANGHGHGSDVRVIDAEGYWLTPGFIDMHAHSDLYLLSHPDHEPKISQGCTTEVVGQDGISYAPVNNRKELRAIRDQIAGWNGNPTDEECRTTLAGVGMFEWKTVGEYLDCLERNRTATNVAMLVPQGNLRLLACGPYDTEATSEEVQKQVVLLREAMSQGAVGMSSGLTYTPGMYAATSELAVLCKMLAEEYPGAYYAPHHRGYGVNALGNYDEMLQLGRVTGCPVHLTHATLNFSENKGKAPALLSMIDQARSDGCDITLDTYPYLPGCTTLASLLPSWASSGGPADTLERLDDPALRAKIAHAVEVTGCDGGHGIPTNWAEIQIGETCHPTLEGYAGRRIADLAAEQDVPCIELFFDILVKDRLATSCLMHIGNEENVQTIMKHETHMSGSDAILHGKSTHPRAYGTFPRFLGHYARDMSLLPIEEMVSHVTSRPAKRLGIYPHRGLVAKGSAADLVLFDPRKIKDRATFEEPKLRADGIRFVLVNGHVALDEGEMTGARGGRTLRRQADGSVVTLDQAANSNGNGKKLVNGH